MAPSDTAFVLVSGAFTPASFNADVTTILQAKGHEVLETELLSASPHLRIMDGKKLPPATMYEDTDHIRAAISSLTAKGKDVVLAVTSYGGFPATEVGKYGLHKKEEGDTRGALVGLVYFASFLPPLGDSLRSLAGDIVMTGNPGEYMVMSDEAAAPVIFSDLPPAEQIRRFKEMRPHSSDSLEGKVTYEAYKEIPSVYVLSEGDMILPPKLQEEMIEAAIANGGKVKKVSVPNAGHCLVLSQPELAANILLEAGGQKTQ